MKFTDLLQQHRIPTAPHGHHHARDGWVQICCPWCDHGSKKFHLGYNVAGQYLNCWKCGKKDLVHTIAVLTGLNFDEVKEVVKGIPREYVPATVHTGLLKFPSNTFDVIPNLHREYLVGRGFYPDNLVRMWNIKFTTIHPTLPWRVVIPIYHCGELVSWTSRSVGDNPPRRYISADANEEAIPHKTILYGEDYCRHACVILEGPLDVWAVGPGAVATCGTSYTRQQLLAMSKYPVRAICFDSSTDAQERAGFLMRELSAFPGETLRIRLESGEDAADAHPDEIQALRTEVFGL